MHESSHLYGLALTSNKDMDTQTHPIHTSQNSTPLGEWAVGRSREVGKDRQAHSPQLVMLQSPIEQARSPQLMMLQSPIEQAHSPQLWRCSRPTSKHTHHSSTRTLTTADDIAVAHRASTLTTVDGVAAAPHICTLTTVPHAHSPQLMALQSPHKQAQAPHFHT